MVNILNESECLSLASMASANAKVVQWLLSSPPRDLRLEQQQLLNDIQAKAERQTKLRRLDIEEVRKAEDIPDSKSKQRLRFARVDVFGGPEVVSVSALVDTGMAVSAMSLRVALKCGLDIDPTVKAMFTGLATERSLTVGYLPVVTIRMGNGQDLLWWRFHVLNKENTNYDMVIGLDFLEKHKAKLDFEDMVLQLGPQNIPMTTDNAPPSPSLGS